jgi:hypothetical protein
MDQHEALTVDARRSKKGLSASVVERADLNVEDQFASRASCPAEIATIWESVEVDRYVDVRGAFDNATTAWTG